MGVLTSLFRYLSFFLKIFIFSCIILSFGSYAGERVSIQMTEQIMDDLDSPAEVIKYLSKFQYETDREFLVEPKVKYPHLFLSDKRGDCKDFALFAWLTAIYHGIPTRYMAVYPKDKDRVGHAFCLWKINNEYYPLCNVTIIGKSIPTKFKTISQVIDFYKKSLDYKEVKDYYPVFPLPYALCHFPDLIPF